MKKTILLIFGLILTIGAGASVTFWGANGHRAVGEIAQRNLSEKASKKVDEILNGHSLAFASTYADEIKSDDRYDAFYTWHYVNFEHGEKYDAATANPKGDLIQGINKCVEVLKDPKSSMEDQQFYLKMLTHLIGDLHQPLHVGHGSDKGGNDVKVKWFYKNSNLHTVWDSKMISSYGMSYSELCDNVDQLSDAQKANIQSGVLMDWVYESQNLAEKVYASCNPGDNLSYEYMYEYFPILRTQLQKGGLRLASVLNEIYE
ncbi:MAG: S1/P1 nuclease [Flavobacteriaceae bacterium]